MIVREFMTKKVVVGRPDMTVLEAAQKMRDGDFGMLPIGEKDRLIGMVTDRDIAIRAVAEKKDPDQVQVREIMSKAVYYCFDDQTGEEVLKNLGEKQVRRLPVLNRQKRLVGILALADLALANLPAENLEKTLSQISNHNMKGQSQARPN